MNLSRTALCAVALTLSALPARAQDAAEVQRKMQEAYQHMVQANELLQDVATRGQGIARYDEACKVYQEALTALPSAGFPAEALAELTQIAHYNIACARSLQGRSDEAFAALEQAIASGWADLEHMSKDPDLAPLRGMERYAQVTSKLTAARDAKVLAAAKEALTKGKLFDYDFKVQTLDGKPLKLKDLRGKVVIVDYWGTWCGPCREEIPHLVKLQKQFGEKLAVVGLTWEHGSSNEETVAKVKEFMEEFGIEYPVSLLSDPTELRKVPNFEGFPTTLFIDKAGQVRVKEVGYRPFVALEALVKGLLAEETVVPAEPQEKKKPKDGYF